MGIFAKLFNKNSEEVSSKNVEDFVSLTRVYFQSVIAANLGITNIRFVPDVANFKRLFKIPTQGGRLGQAEKTASRKMLMQDYGISENFFKEIDASVKKHCRTQNDVQGYLFMYQGFSNDLMMLMGNLMQWKFRMPSIFKGALRSMTEKTVHEVCTKAVWKKDDVHKTAMTVRKTTVMATIIPSYIKLVNQLYINHLPLPHNNKSPSSSAYSARYSASKACRN